METEGDFSGVEFLQVKRSLLVLTKRQLDACQPSQSKSCTLSTYYAYSSAAYSEGGTVTHTPPWKAWLDFLRQRRWTDGWVRETASACMLTGKGVHPPASHLCAPVWIHSRVSDVNLSKPFKNTHFSSR